MVFTRPQLHIRAAPRSKHHGYHPRSSRRCVPLRRSSPSCHVDPVSMLPHILDGWLSLLIFGCSFSCQLHLLTFTTLSALCTAEYTFSFIQRIPPQSNTCCASTSSCRHCRRRSSAARSNSLAFTTPAAPSSEMIPGDTSSRGVLPKDRKAMTQALTGETATIDFRDRDYFPLTYPLLFPHGAVCGWYPDMKSTTGHKISLTQWLTQLLVTEPRFQKLGPLVNEFVIDVFSCIEDQRLSFHAHNQDKYRTSVHHASAVARVPRPRRDKAPGAEKIIVPSSFTQGFADQAKKMTVSMYPKGSARRILNYGALERGSSSQSRRKRTYTPSARR